MRVVSIYAARLPHLRSRRGAAGRGFDGRAWAQRRRQVQPLEALYFGCTGHALRTRNERELVRFGERASRVTVAVSDGDGPHELSVGYGRRRGCRAARQAHVLRRRSGRAAARRRDPAAARRLRSRPPGAAQGLPRAPSRSPRPPGRCALACRALRRAAPTPVHWRSATRCSSHIRSRARLTLDACPPGIASSLARDRAARGPRSRG